MAGNQRDYSLDWRSMTLSQQRQVLNAWAKTANRRLRRLREKGIEVFDGSYEAGRFLQQVGRKTFFTEKSKIKNPALVQQTLVYLQGFLLNDASTISGIKRIVVEKILQKVDERRKQSGREIIGRNVNYQQFYDFLHSGLYKEARQIFESDEIIADYVYDYERGNIKKTLRAYEEFLSHEIGYDEFREKIESDQYQSGKA